MGWLWCWFWCWQNAESLGSRNLKIGDNFLWLRAAPAQNATSYPANANGPPQPNWKCFQICLIDRRQWGQDDIGVDSWIYHAWNCYRIRVRSLAMLVSNSLHWLTHSLHKDANSKLVEFVTVAVVDDEKHFDNSFMQSWKLKFGHKAKFCSDFEH